LLFFGHFTRLYLFDSDNIVCFGLVAMTYASKGTFVDVVFALIVPEAGAVFA
jgi:hypothetical protein